jgi:hypothetical protein
VLIIRPIMDSGIPVTESQWLAATDPAEMVDWLDQAGRLSERKARLFMVACCRRLWPQVMGGLGARAVKVAERYADGGATEADLRQAHNALHAEVYWVREAETWWGQRVLEFLHRLGGASDDPWAYDFPPTPFDLAVLATASRTALEAARVVARRVVRVPEGFEGDQAATEAARASLVCDLLRHHFGNPFRPSRPPAAALLAWNGGVLRHLAQAAYEYPTAPMTTCHQEPAVRRGPQRPRPRLPLSPEPPGPPGEMDPVHLAVLADALEEAGFADPEMLAHLRGPGPHERGCWAVDAVLSLG